MIIRETNIDDESVGNFMNVEFAEYATGNEVVLNYQEFCFVAEDDGNVIGAINGRAYYNEVHIQDLIIGKGCRRDGLGTSLVTAVEDKFRGQGYDFVALTTFGFQAPEFYKKLGYKLEFVRECSDPKLNKYFYRKDF